MLISVASFLLCGIGGIMIKTGQEPRTQYTGGALLLVGILIGFVSL